MIATLCVFNVHVASAAGQIHSKRFEFVPGKTVFSRSVQINMLLKLFAVFELQNTTTKFGADS